MQQTPLRSLREINQLPEAEKLDVYRRLIPGFLLERYDIDPVTLSFEGKPVIQFRCPAGTRALEVFVRRRAGDIDPMIYLNMADTFSNQLIVLLLIVNDPAARRYDIDRDEDGNPTHLGTAGRNVHAEEAAMRAGLAPGQVRQGLRVFKQMVPIFEDFVASLGHDLFFIEPLAYHNAIVFERYGFNYLRGRSEMESIHREFQPGGALHRRLTGSTPFRMPEASETVRGRSWAIHDGILGHSYTGFQMYKRIGHHAGVVTFPGSRW